MKTTKLAIIFSLLVLVSSFSLPAISLAEEKEPVTESSVTAHTSGTWVAPNVQTYIGYKNSKGVWVTRSAEKSIAREYKYTGNSYYLMYKGVQRTFDQAARKTLFGRMYRYILQ